jgi:FMN phosphatase YigB (HAD superfamily)
MKITPFSPKTHIFLWDLHEVILEKDRRTWFKTCIRFNRKWELLRKLNKKALTIFFTFVLERLKIIKKQMVSEELIQAARTTNNEAFVDLITTICSSYVPIKGTVDIMSELSALGYKHHLGSNIGKTVFDNCLQKYPTVFTVFEAYAIAFNRTETEIIKKPHPDFFLTHVQKQNLEPHNFIFIDDRKANVLAAQSVGMHGIHFKNAKQLRDELIKHGVIKSR